MVRTIKMWLVSCVALAAMLGASARTQAQTGPIRISQIFPRGGTSATLPNADYVELFNASDSTVSLNGWSVQTTGAAGVTWNVVPIFGSLQSRRYYLVRLEPASGTGTTFLVNTTTTGAGIDQAGGKVALVSSTTPLSGAPACWLPASVLDFVGYGTANQRQPCSGTAADNAPAGTATQAIFRKCGGFADGRSNAVNFNNGAPSPRNLSSPPSSDGLVAFTVPATFSYTSGTASSYNITGVINCDGSPIITADLSEIGGSASASVTFVSSGTYRVNLPANALSGRHEVRVTVRGASHIGTLTKPTAVTVLPGNDTCAGALNVGSVLPRSFGDTSVIDATDTGDGLLTCGGMRVAGTVNRGTWYRFVAPANGRFLVQLGGPGLVSAADAVDFYTGSCGALAAVCPLGTGEPYFGRAIAVTIGTAYYIKISRTDRASFYTLDATFDLQPTGAFPQDLVCTAPELMLGVAQPTRMLYATGTNDGPQPVHCGDDYRWAAWYRFTPPSTGAYALDFCGTLNSADHDLFTVTGCPGTPTFTRFDPVGVCPPQVWVCNDLPLAGGGQSTGGAISVYTLSGGVTYFIRVTHFANGIARSGATVNVRMTGVGACCTDGLCVLTFESMCHDTPRPMQFDDGYYVGRGTFRGVGSVCTPAPCGPPSNDLCDNAIPMTRGQTYHGSLREATGNALEGPMPTCIAFPATRTFSRSVWYSFVPPTSGYHEISLCNSDADTIVDVMTGPCIAPTLMPGVCNDNGTCPTLFRAPGAGGPNPNASRIPSVWLEAGTRYVVRVSASTFISTGGPNAALSYGLRILQTGRCCIGTTCSTLTEEACVSPGPGVWAAYNPAAHECPPIYRYGIGCCFADFDKSGVVSIDDIFLYLNAWFAASPYTRMWGNPSSTPTLDDIFVFLNAWFAGCPL